MIVYKSEIEARKDALANPNLVLLPELINKNCKKCLGKGYTGRLILDRSLEDDNPNKYQYLFCKCLINNFEKKVKEINLRKRFA